MVRIDINVTPVGGQGMSQGQPQQKIYLNAPTILKFLIGNDAQLNDLIILSKKPMMTTDKELYEAIGSLAKYDSFAPTKLSKLFEVVDVYPHRDLTRTEKPLLTFEKVEVIRKEALRQSLPQTEKKESRENAAGKSAERRKQREQGFRKSSAKKKQ
jgi:hypothetical protein